MIQTLILNAALLVTLATLHNMFARMRIKGKLWPKIISGLLFGAVAIGGMNLPLHYSPGVIYDGRSTIMVLAGLFGGGITALVSVLVAGIYRAVLGGGGVWAGMSTIAGCALVGLAFRRLIGNRPAKLTVAAMYGIGIAAHIVMLACQLLVIPWPSGLWIIRDIWKPVMLIFPAATALIGFLLREEEKRLEIEMELQESENKFRGVFENALEGILIANTKTHRFLMGNKAICKMLGYEPEELLYLTVDDIHPKSELANVYNDFDERTYQANRKREFQVLRKDGSIFDAEINSSPLSIGDCPCLIGIFHDITDRKMAERALRESEGKYRTLVENIPQKIFFKNKQSVFIAANENFARDLGIQAKAIEGKTDFDFFPKELAQKYRSDDKRIIKNKVTEGLDERYIQDGQERIIHTIKTPVMDDNEVIGVLGVFWDITEQKQAEEALKSLNLRHETLLAAIPEIVMEVDQNKIYTWSNNAGREFFGEDVVGQHADTYFEGEQNTYQAVQPLFNGNHQTIYVESWQRRKDGEKRLLAWWCRSLVDADGKVSGALSSARDITEIRKAEEEVIRLNKELEQRVEERTAELKIANEELESFAYSVSHDLRAPLRAIHGFSEILIERHRSSLNEEGREYLGYVIEASNRMDQLIDDLLQYSRLGQHAVRQDQIDSQMVLDEVLHELAGEITRTDAEIIVPRSLPQIRGDGTLLTQVLLNLVDNAIKYQPTGHRPQVTITCDESEKQITLHVADNGIGIPPEHQEKIFNLFQRLHSAEEFPGTGVGLALVKKAVEHMDGKVGVRSQPGKGSDFWVQLPGG